MDPTPVELNPVVPAVHLVRISLATIDEQIDAPTPWIAVLDVWSIAMERVAQRAGASGVITRDDGLGVLTP